MAPDDIDEDLVGVDILTLGLGDLLHGPDKVGSHVLDGGDILFGHCESFRGRMERIDGVFHQRCLLQEGCDAIRNFGL